MSEGIEEGRPTAVDLFCGAGGASCGIENAGFKLLSAVDNDTEPLDTHARNLSGYTVKHDLSQVEPAIFPKRAQSPDYVHGSPPCKGFSNANDDRRLDDPRNTLVFSFIDWVEQLQPRVVTMENVTGMLTISTEFMSDIQGQFRDAGYQVKHRTLNAADYGVPQTRKRVITVAVRDDQPTPTRWYPHPTHAETATKTLDGRTLDEWVTVEEAIRDIAGQVNEHRPQGENNGTSAAIWRSGSPSHTVKGQGSHVVRADGGEFLMTDQINEAHQRAGRRPLQNSNEPSNTMRVGTPPLIFNHNPRPSTDNEPHDWECEEPAETLQADARLPDKKRAPGPKSSHWEGARRLTVRECARIQSFPDSFVFDGTKTSQYAQVGNAVPPRLQLHIANHLKKLLSR